MKPMPKEPRVFPPGTLILSKATSKVYELTDEMCWDGVASSESWGALLVPGEPKGCRRRLAAGTWPGSYEEPDYTWREIGRNTDSIHWECMRGAERYECVSVLGMTADRIRAPYVLEWRAKLGKHSGWWIQSGGTWISGCGYEVLDEPPAPPPAAVAPAAPKPSFTDRRKHLIAALSLELDLSPAERMRRKL